MTTTEGLVTNIEIGEKQQALLHQKCRVLCLQWDQARTKMLQDPVYLSSQSLHMWHPCIATCLVLSNNVSVMHVHALCTKATITQGLTQLCIISILFIYIVTFHLDSESTTSNEASRADAWMYGPLEMPFFHLLFISTWLVQICPSPYLILWGLNSRAWYRKCCETAKEQALHWIRLSQGSKSSVSGLGLLCTDICLCSLLLEGWAPNVWRPCATEAPLLSSAFCKGFSLSLCREPCRARTSHRSRSCCLYQFFQDIFIQSNVWIEGERAFLLRTTALHTFSL